jgi:transcriptional regulator with XRE-family HTH domain
VSRYANAHQKKGYGSGMDFDDLIRRSLRTSGKTQADFARELGVTQSTVSRWLSGKAKPEVQHWIAVRAFLARHGNASHETDIARPTVPLIGASPFHI